jgi:hypothetical protein
MVDVKAQISAWMKIEKSNLNEIAIDDVEFADFAQQNINIAVSQMLNATTCPSIEVDTDCDMRDGLPCKSYWVESTHELIIYLWNGYQTKAIVVPQEGWMLREDIVVH